MVLRTHTTRGPFRRSVHVTTAVYPFRGTAFHPAGPRRSRTSSTLPAEESRKRRRKIHVRNPLFDSCHLSRASSPFLEREKQIARRWKWRERFSLYSTRNNENTYSIYIIYHFAYWSKLLIPVPIRSFWTKYCRSLEEQIDAEKMSIPLLRFAIRGAREKKEEERNKESGNREKETKTDSRWIRGTANWTARGQKGVGNDGSGAGRAAVTVELAKSRVRESNR